jgi:hypothetical protein
MRVKGSLVLDLVKLIRSERDRNWDKYLKSEDWKIINSIILASNWYPGESYWRITYAVTQELAGMNLDSVYLFGRNNAKTVMKVYGHLLIAPGDPVATVKNSVKYRESLYDFEGANIERTKIENGANWIRCIVQVFPGITFREMVEPFFHGMAGYYHEMVERASGKAVRATVKNMGEFFEIYLAWE